MALFEINIPGIVFCAVLWFGLLSLWYSPLLFEKGRLRTADGQPVEAVRYLQLWVLLAAFLSGVLVDVVLNAYALMGGTVNWRTGAAIGLLIWLGAAVPMRLLELSDRRTTFDVFLIDASITALCYFLTGLLLGNWSSGGGGAS